MKSGVGMGVKEDNRFCKLGGFDEIEATDLAAHLQTDLIISDNYTGQLLLFGNSSNNCSTIYGTFTIRMALC